MKRDSFIFYSSFAQAAALLGDKARLKLYDSIVKLSLSCAENETDLNRLCNEIESSLAQSRNVLAQFLLIKPQIISNSKKFLNGCKGAEYGAFGGAPKGNKNAKKNNPETTPNDNVNVNVNENDNDIPPVAPPSGEDTPKDKMKQKRFTPPTVEEVRSFVTEHGYSVDAEKFVNFYASKGWVVGRSPMKDWRAAVRTWEADKKTAAYSEQKGKPQFKSWREAARAQGVEV